MNQALVLAGSNVDEANQLHAAQQKLKSCFKILKQSRSIYTQPLGKQYQKPFLDQVFLIETGFDEQDFILKLKTLETELGRKPEHKQQGIIPIDIDLLMWNGQWRDEDLLKDEMIRAIVKEVVSIQN